MRRCCFFLIICIIIFNLKNIFGWITRHTKLFVNGVYS